jgi:DNA-binding NarL/FixJ family response regulator
MNDTNAAAAGRPPTVLVADDHLPTRALVRPALERGGFVVCSEAASAAAAVALAATHQPDVCLLDINMPGNGIAAAARIAEKVPSAAVVMLTVSRDDADLLDALKAGARGYLLKDVDHARIPAALRQVLAGEAPMAGTLVARLVQEFRRREERRVCTPDGEVRLSDREWEVLELLQQHRTTAQIARELYVAPVTVRTHVAAILRNLRVGSREEMLRLLDDGDRTPAFPSR